METCKQVKVNPNPFLFFLKKSFCSNSLKNRQLPSINDIKQSSELRLYIDNYP